MKPKRSTSYSFRKEMKEKCGSVCASCGSSENIEYHHIVPLFLGGSDELSNIVPLCHRCHEAAHNGRHMTEYRSEKAGGRKSNKSDEEAFKVFDMFVGGEIGKRKAQELLGYSSRTGITDRAQFKKYAKMKGIKEVHNIVDIVATNSPQNLCDGWAVGKITYEDDSWKFIRYKDTGVNDVEYTPRDNTLATPCATEVEEDRKAKRREKPAPNTPTKRNENINYILTPQEAARLLGVTPSRLCYLRRRGIVCGFVTGRCTFRYRRSEIERALFLDVDLKKYGRGER